MFEQTKDRFYKSLGESIRKRKEELELKGNNILLNDVRVSKIVNNKRNKHYPYLIGKGEYPYLIYLFIYEDHDSFINAKIKKTPENELIEKCGNNYDKMLWEHINWDEMFENVLLELSELDILENPKKLKELEKLKKPKELEKQKKIEKLFKDTLVDYAPYAVIRYDELVYNYGKRAIFPDEKKEKMQKAIERVHSSHGSGLFKQTFLEKFSGKTLREFDKGFLEFISDYLNKRMPNEYSLGQQAYNFHKNLSEFVAYWRELPEVQYNDVSDEKSESQTVLNEYIQSGLEQLSKFEKYQKAFDDFHIDI